MLVSKIEQYYKTPFDSEAELEQVVQDYAEQLFGSNAPVLLKARIPAVGGAALDYPDKNLFPILHTGGSND